MMPGTADGVANHQSFCKRSAIVAAGRLDRKDLAAGLHQQDVFLADMAEQFAILERGERHASAQVGSARLLVLGHGVASLSRRGSIVRIGQPQQLLARQRIVAEHAEHAAGDEIGPGLVRAARGHAVMRRLDDDPDTFGPQHIVDRVGDLRGHLLLDLKPLGVDVDETRELGDADDAPLRDISDPGAADDRCHVVLAMAFEANAAQDDHLVVAFDLLKGLLQDFGRILRIAGEILLEGARDPVRRIAQTVARGIVAGPADHGPDRLLDLRPLRPLARRLRDRDTFQPARLRLHRKPPLQRTAYRTRPHSLDGCDWKRFPESGKIGSYESGKTAGREIRRYEAAFRTSSTAWAHSAGRSCGKLWPAPAKTRRSKKPANLPAW